MRGVSALRGVSYALWIVFALPLGCMAAERGVVPAVSAPVLKEAKCSEESTVSMYFPDFADSTTSQWLAPHLCAMREPGLKGRGMDAPKEIRCVYAMSFEPIVVVRLRERECELNWTVLDHREEPNLIRSGRTDAGSCGGLIEKIVRNARLENDAKHRPPQVEVVDGASWLFEVVDGGRYFFYASGFYPEINEDVRNPWGAEKACKELIEAARGPLKINGGLPDR
ncbi:hypothetical protein G4177_31710 [Corallococcus sp. ZKHCc1 1396]|uniref:DUF3558 domain-containing protein n=1 Tax=Corallococcus soli TaxID=2710757 RepID=A0ABR9PXS5_9BACT|nr:hypothetical protein [Corallococcus soli]MBE4752732.1 hypothetical protein [Corallococcus soli]